MSKNLADLRIQEIRNGYLLYLGTPCSPGGRSVLGEEVPYFHSTVEQLLDAIELMLVPPECSCVGEGSQLPAPWRHNQECHFFKANLAQETPVGRSST